VLVVGPGPEAGPESEPEPAAGEEDRALALALASASGRQRAHLLELIDYAAARLEAKLAPWGVDLAEDEGDAVVQLGHELAIYVPSLTAARELDRGAWKGPGLVVRVAADCGRANVGPDETCAPLWTGASEREVDAPLVRRGRLLAWAAAGAGIVDLDRAEAFEAGARALRERTNLSGSTLALVLEAADLGLRPVPEREALEAAAGRLGRAMAANRVHERSSHLDALGRAAPAGRAASWLSLGPTSLVVVPRLSAIARRDDFVREIETALGGVPMRWRRKP
jgi:hypothetical protein